MTLVRMFHGGRAKANNYLEKVRSASLLGARSVSWLSVSEIMNRPALVLGALLHLETRESSHQPASVFSLGSWRLGQAKALSERRKYALDVLWPRKVSLASTPPLGAMELRPLRDWTLSALNTRVTREF